MDFDWLSLLRALQVVVEAAFAGIRSIAELVGVHFDKLIGLAGFSFGVWRWWYTRERVLHKRLQEYIAEQDRRLEQARADVLEAIHRPGPRREFAEPLFAVGPLRRVLWLRRWGALLDFRRIEASAERSLDKAVSEIEHRIGIAVAALTSLRAQMASAYLLKGAVASARASAKREGPQRIDFDDRALIQFRTVLQVHDHERDVQAKEYEAHELRRLGHLAEADAAYEQLEEFTGWVPDDKTRNLTLARSRRYRAQIAQAQYIWQVRDGRRVTAKCPNAHSWLMNSEGVLALRQPHGQFREWQAIEQGECHYVAAFVCHHYAAVAQEPVQLSQAESTFRQVLSQTPRRWFMRSSAKQLRIAAQAGLDRVQRAQTNADYDTDWLMPRT